MTDVCFYFQVHQPFRLRHLGALAPRKAPLAPLALLAAAEDARIVRRVAERGYLPTNELLARCIEETDGAFRCAFSISGTALSQLEAWAPEALQSFVDLAETGCAEILCETSHHSLAALVDPDEFRSQVDSHRRRITELFGVEPTAFRNTELVISEPIARMVEDMGFEALLGEGADGLLKGRSAHVVWQPRGCSKLALLLRDYPLSDDIAFRFSNVKWPGHPLFADTFARWLADEPPPNDFLGLFMDFETFGEHQDRSTGILDFLAALPGQVLEYDHVRFATPTEVARAFDAAGELEIPRPISWMQRAAHAALYDLAPSARRAAEGGAPELLEAWRRLSTSDHVYYMATKADTDGDVHEYFSPYPRPHEAFLNFMNVLDELSSLLETPRPGAQQKLPVLP